MSENHLQYLLTAYVFGDISAAGRAEVEQHLAMCAACRERLAELRATATAVEDALGGASDAAANYSFEARRLERVLAASRAHHSPLRRVLRNAWLNAAAAILITLPVIYFVVRGTRDYEMGCAPAPEGRRSEWKEGSDSMSAGAHQTFVDLPKSAALPAEPQLQAGYIADENQSQNGDGEYDGREVIDIGDSTIGVSGGTAAAYGQRWGKGRTEGDESHDSASNERSEVTASEEPASEAEVSPEIVTFYGEGPSRSELEKRKAPPSGAATGLPSAGGLAPGDGDGGNGGVVVTDVPDAPGIVIGQEETWPPGSSPNELAYRDAASAAAHDKPRDIPLGTTMNPIVPPEAKPEAKRELVEVAKKSLPTPAAKPQASTPPPAAPAPRAATAGEMSDRQDDVRRRAGVDVLERAGESQSAGGKDAKAPRQEPAAVVAHELKLDPRSARPSESLGERSDEGLFKFNTNKAENGAEVARQIRSELERGDKKVEVNFIETKEGDVLEQGLKFDPPADAKQTIANSPVPESRLSDLGGLAADPSKAWGEGDSATFGGGDRLNVPDSQLGQLAGQSSWPVHSESMDALSEATKDRGRTLIKGEQDAKVLAGRTKLDKEKLQETIKELRKEVESLKKDDDDMSSALSRLKESHPRTYEEVIVSATPVPPIDGQIVAVRPETGIVVVSIGQEDKLESGVKLNVYRGDEFIGKVQTTKVAPDMAGAEVLYLDGDDKIQVGDHVTTYPLTSSEPSLETRDATAEGQSDGSTRILLSNSTGAVQGFVTSIVHGDEASAGEQVNLLAAKDESALRAYHHYRARDPQLTTETFQARRITIPAPAVGDEGLGELGFREHYKVNPFVDTQRDHLSTFAMDVDTASYTRARALLRTGELPKPSDVRVEEFVNFFKQDYPADPERSFSVFCDGGPAPFGDSLEELKITVKARELTPGERKSAVLTFAIDTSGSMGLERRLEQVQYALAQLLASDEIRPDDRIAIVGYGTQPFLALPHTPARERGRILGALASLESGGSTNVEAGLQFAYRLADDSFHPKAQNRVILCTDGVATSGARGADEILSKVQVFARRGIYLSVVGFGRKQYNDALLERIADQGNGNYNYVDSRDEAARIFVSNLPATLQVLARDAKIQVDFNPAVVTHYRLLGYENRDIKDADFRNDTVDAGEVGPGATVTAIYEIRRRPAAHGELGKVALRFHDNLSGRVEELDFPLAPGVLATRLAQTTDGFRFIAAAAEFAELLRGSYWARNGSYGAVLELLAGLSPEFRARPEWQELFELVARAQQLTLRDLANK